jgi:hypothetical protein
MSEANSQDISADFRIAYDGTWYHDGAPILREALAKLFSDRALSVDEDGRYWLKTPFEKYPVLVEDVPYIIVDYTDEDGHITMRTNMGETVTLDKNSKWELREGIPYIEVRGGLYARIGRAVYYNLVQDFGAQLTSGGQSFPLGELD